MNFLPRHGFLYLLMAIFYGSLIALVLSKSIFQPVEAAYQNNATAPAPTPTTYANAEEFVAQITGEDCVIPCWFGWVLGAANLAQVLEKVDVFSHEKSIVGYPGYPTYSIVSAVFNFPGQDEDLEPFLGFNFIMDNELDTLVAIGTNINLAAAPPMDRDVLTPNELVNLYGVPSTLIFQIHTPSGGLPWYELTLQYKAPDLAMQYRGGLEPTENNDGSSVCLAAPFYIVSYIQVDDVPLMGLTRGELENSTYLSRNRVMIAPNDLIKLFSDSNSCISIAPKLGLVIMALP
jgi:hypothetical protein